MITYIFELLVLTSWTPNHLPANAHSEFNMYLLIYLNLYHFVHLFLPE